MKPNRLRTIGRHTFGLFLLAACGCSPMAMKEAAGGSTHLFAWAWDVDKGAGDFLAVVDVDRRSPTYGQVVTSLPTAAGRGAHHTEYEMSTGQLFANSFDTGRTFVFDLGDPAHPRFIVCNRGSSRVINIFPLPLTKDSKLLAIHSMQSRVIASHLVIFATIDERF
jgi:hypothetical protein